MALEISYSPQYFDHRTEAMPHWGGAQLVHASSGRMEEIK